MKNPLLTIIALLVLAGVLFAQSFPPGGGAHAIIRKIELVGPIQVEGIVPLRNHISIPWTVSADAAGVSTPFEWTCPEGMHARVTMISDTDYAWNRVITKSGWSCAIQLSTGEIGFTAWGRSGINGGAAFGHPPLETVLHPGDILRIDDNHSQDSSTMAGILQLAVEYD